MSSTIPSRLDDPVDPAESAGVARSEPGGRGEGTQGMTYEIGGVSPDLGP